MPVRRGQLRVEDKQRMKRNENVMLRLMCGVTLTELGWGYEGYGANARDGNGPREVEMWHHRESI